MYSWFKSQVDIFFSQIRLKEPRALPLRVEECGIKTPRRNKNVNFIKKQKKKNKFYSEMRKKVR